MVSRDTLVHLVALALGTGLLAAWLAITDGPMVPERDLAPLGLAVVLVWYFVVFAGAHFVLAVRGEDGVVPTAARWRFVLALGATLVLLGVAALFATLDPVFGVRPELPALATALAVFLGWFVYEARQGYRERAPAG
jgi:hypothetical protein